MCSPAPRARTSMIVPRAGWAEHRAEEDWWGDFVWLSRKLLADSGLARSEIKAVGASGDRPLHAAGRRRRRAADERGALWRRYARGARDRGSDRRADRRGRDPRALRQRADVAIGRPEDSVAEAQPAGHFRRAREVPQLDVVSSCIASPAASSSTTTPPPTRSPLYLADAPIGARRSRPTSSSSIACPISPGRPRLLAR